MKTPTTQYNQERDAQAFIGKGLYHGHIVNLATKPWKDSIMINLTCRIAEACASQEYPQQVQDSETKRISPKLVNGETVMKSGANLVGRRIFADTLWFCPDPGEDGWKNNKYRDAIVAMGVQLERDAEGNEGLGEIEDEDVLCKPVLLHVSETSYMKDGVKTYSMKVTGFSAWVGGEDLDPSILIKKNEGDNQPEQNADVGF